jgi:hypothetical protein
VTLLTCSALDDTAQVATATPFSLIHSPVLHHPRMNTPLAWAFHLQIMQTGGQSGCSVIWFRPTSVEGNVSGVIGADVPAFHLK